MFRYYTTSVLLMLILSSSLSAQYLPPKPSLVFTNQQRDEMIPSEFESNHLLEAQGDMPCGKRRFTTRNSVKIDEGTCKAVPRTISGVTIQDLVQATRRQSEILVIPDFGDESPKYLESFFEEGFVRDRNGRLLYKDGVAMEASLFTINGKTQVNRDYGYSQGKIGITNVMAEAAGVTIIEEGLTGASANVYFLSRIQTAVPRSEQFNSVIGGLLRENNIVTGYLLAEYRGDDGESEINLNASGETIQLHHNRLDGSILIIRYDLRKPGEFSVSDSSSGRALPLKIDANYVNQNQLRRPCAEHWTPTFNALKGHIRVTAGENHEFIKPSVDALLALIPDECPVDRYEGPGIRRRGPRGEKEWAVIDRSEVFNRVW